MSLLKTTARGEERQRYECSKWQTGSKLRRNPNAPITNANKLLNSAAFLKPSGFLRSGSWRRLSSPRSELVRVHSTGTAAVQRAQNHGKACLCNMLAKHKASAWVLSAVFLCVKRQFELTTPYFERQLGRATWNAPLVYTLVLVASWNVLVSPRFPLISLWVIFI